MNMQIFIRICTSQPAPQARQFVLHPPPSQDPEGVFKAPPQQGLIDRKLRNQQIQSDKSYAFQMEKFANEEREARQKKRDARTPPVTPAGMVEYMLETEADEMEYEVARYRPSLDEEFFAYLDKLVGLERLAAKPDEVGGRGRGRGASERPESAAVARGRWHPNMQGDFSTAEYTFRHE
jgi:hypothetical protein